MIAYIITMTIFVALGAIGSISKAISIAKKTYEIPPVDGSFYFGTILNLSLILWGLWLLARTIKP